MTRHKVINGICYLYEVTTTYKGRCEKHNERTTATPKEKEDA